LARRCCATCRRSLTSTAVDDSGVSGVSDVLAVVDDDDDHDADDDADADHDADHDADDDDNVDVGNDAALAATAAIAAAAVATAAAKEEEPEVCGLRRILTKIDQGRNVDGDE
jgi:hypothetical protein